MNRTREMAERIFTVLDDELGVINWDVSFPGGLIPACIDAVEHAIRNHYRTWLTDARIAKRSQGVRCEGKKPYGTHVHEQVVVKWMREQRAEGLSFDAIAQSLNERSVTTRHGKQWHATTVAKILRAQQQLQLGEIAYAEVTKQGVKLVSVNTL